MIGLWNDAHGCNAAVMARIAKLRDWEPTAVAITPVAPSGVREKRRLLIVNSSFSERPSCRYPPVGMPSAHSCPECGFTYDQATVVFKPAMVLLIASWKSDRPRR